MEKETNRKNNKKQNEEEPYTDGEYKSSQIYRKLIRAILQASTRLKLCSARVTAYV